MDINQYGIMFLGSSAIFLVAFEKEKIRRYGYIVGFVSSPFFVNAAIIDKQWGLLIVAIISTISWGNGIRNFWLKPYLGQPK